MNTIGSQNIDVSIDVPNIDVTVGAQTIEVTLQTQGVGPRGPQGLDNGDFSLVAGEALSGQKVVRCVDGELFYASADDATHLGKVVGITTMAAILGDPVDIRTVGYMTDPSFNFVDGPIYLGLNGALTQSYDVGAFMQQVATQLSATEIFVTINPGIMRG